MHSVPSAEAAFARAADSVLATMVRPEFHIEQAPAPQRLAPYALTVTAEATAPAIDSPIGTLSESATGRFVLLHDPDGVEEWEGLYRVVIFSRCDVEPEMLNDPLIHEVAWSWVLDAVEELPTAQIGGTVTITSGTSFGTMNDRPEDGLVEVRASWTPIFADGVHPDGESGLPEHVHAWIDIMSRVAGLPPLPAGIATVGHRSRVT